MTPWHRNEYILKGVFLGLWVFFALQVPAGPAAWVDIAWVVGWVCAGLLVGLLAGTALQLARGVRPWHNWLAFPLLVLLESPTFVYGGITLGLVVGVLSGTPGAEPWAGPLAATFGLTFEQIKHQDPAGGWLGYCAAAGALLGFALYRFRQVEDSRWRFWAGLLAAAALVYLAGEYIQKLPNLDTPEARFNLGVYILLGLPFFYLLTFCGEAEESEVEIMVLCAGLGVGLNLMGFANKFPGIGPAAAFLVPLTLYFVYATRLMPELVTFKHTLRGYSYMNLGRLALAVRFFRRALELDPKSALANQGLATLHNNLTLAQIDADPALVESLDFSLCLDRATALLMPPTPPPTRDQRGEAERFLDLVERKKPAYLARVDYLRAISFMHAKEYDHAADALSRLLNPETPGYHPVVRKRVLFDAWDIALRLHPKMVERLGWDELNKPGRRIEAIAATERKLAAEPSHPAAKEYRTMLYAQLQEGEFISAMATGLPTDFAYEYVEQMGLALLDDADPDRRERGMGYLRIAGRGLPDRAPGLFAALAKVHEKHGDGEGARRAYEWAKQAGLAVGPRNLARDQRAHYHDALRKLADMADQRGDPESAIADLRQYLEDGGPAALDTYKRLADMYGKAGDALNGLLMTETGLTYDSTDAALLRKKDSFYYSVEPEKLEKVKDRVAKWFDVNYCVRKAMSVLNAKDGGVELLDWATHLSRVAAIVKPQSNGVRLVAARVLLRRGERDAGLQMLEDMREGEKGSGEEQEAWYNGTKLLGQLYLDELNRPDLALKCFLDFKEFHKSGADTLYQIGRCYEATGDVGGAVKFYGAVTAYEGHALYWDAKDALKRLGKG
ncbi:MAG: hypothetical protein C0501_01425 [Isosphaera sp.]|nr:hypothetical protein [Isosphaera sp.]